MRLGRLAAGSNENELAPATRRSLFVYKHVM